MGGSQSSEFQKLKVVVAGMPRAGAKSLVERMTKGVFVENAGPAALDSHLLTRKFEQLTLQLLPVGSQQGLWQDHFSTAERLVFVVDGSEPIDEAAFRSAFEKAIGESRLPEAVPVVLLINKVDADPDDDKKADAFANASLGAEVQAKVSATAASCARAGTMVQFKAIMVSAKTGYHIDETIRVVCGSTLVF
eukprot:TRINITY_DN75293_c0_g1_i1.p1 TRINITY_DN75293_c0_g1~~TRINITY_DN75293_c0_g1_i1.p1  ORF type:complete len:192 (+),score=43.53 TRINITY_DN75293_c0_g1_i1:145-720(+)